MSDVHMKVVGRKDVCLFVEYESVMNVWIPALSSSDGEKRGNALKQLCQIWDKYLECPTLLDPYLSNMVTTLAKSSLANDSSSEDDYYLVALYTLCKVRGRKQVQRYLPQEVYHLETIMTNLTSDSTSNRWECEYVWLVWLGQLSLIPFPISTTNSTLEGIWDICQSYFHHAGPLRIVSSSTYALWLSRSSTDTSCMKKFFQTIQQQLQSYYKSSHKTSKEQCYLMGWMQACAVFFQRMTHSNILIQKHIHIFWTTLLQAIEQETSSVLLQKLYIKNMTRIGCLFLPPKIASWRYQRGRRSLLQNLNKSHEISQKNEIQQQQQQQQQSTSSTTNYAEDEEIWYVAEEVEDVMDVLLRKGLCHEATVVRWSAAKGIGRLTERLPSICAQDVVDGLFMVDDQHGVCLALAELARRGLLLPAQLEKVITTVVIPAFLYDVPKKGAASVRDAACYTCWAFARAYSPNDLLSLSKVISQAMIVLCLFDREVNCRRAASAAIQEWVGRLGNIPHGIDIFTIADYTSLGNRTDAYTTLALSIAKYQIYTLPILQHLLTHKYQHWDPSIRILTSQALPPIITTFLSQNDKNVSYIVETILLQQMIPKCINIEEHVHSRHGALLAVAEITLALSTTTNKDWADYAVLVDSLANLVSTVEQKRLYRGKGGELIRAACLRVVECVTLANIPLTVKQQVRCLDTIDASLSYPNIPHQQAACCALQALLKHYFPISCPGKPSQRLQQRIVLKYTTVVSTDENISATRGYALALGQLPKRIFTYQNLETTLNCLSQVANPNHDNNKEDCGDADTRTHALQSIIQLCQAFQQKTSVENELFLTKEQWDLIFQTLLLSMNDYNMDRRGDVGSWCRIQAMKGLVLVVPLAIQTSNIWNQKLCTQIIGALFKQLAEKLDNVREVAGTSLEQLLLSTTTDITFIANKEKLIEVLGLSKSNEKDAIIWSDSNITFSLVLEVISVSSEFFEYILSGMIISVGGLTERVQKASASALLNWFRKLSQKKEEMEYILMKFINTIMKLFRNHTKDGRVILPLLKTCDIVLSRGCLDSVILQEGYVDTLRQLLTCLKKEGKQCTDVIRLLQIFIVALGLLRGKSKSFIRDEVFPYLLKFLVHPYPRVRRGCAEQLYVKLLEDFPSILNIGETQQDFILDILSKTVWDDNHTNNFRKARNEIADLFSIHLSENDRVGFVSKSISNDKKIDEFKSYASLVHEAGR